MCEIKSQPTANKTWLIQRNRASKMPGQDMINNQGVLRQGTLGFQVKYFDFFELYSNRPLCAIIRCTNGNKGLSNAYMQDSFFVVRTMLRDMPAQDQIKQHKHEEATHATRLAQTGEARSLLLGYRRWCPAPLPLTMPLSPLLPAVPRPPQLLVLKVGRRAGRPGR